jgi:hypothetical protein
MCQNFGNKGKVQRKEYVGNTTENEIKESEKKKEYRYLGIAENHNIEQKK